MGRIIAIGGGFPREDTYKLAHRIMALTGKTNPHLLQIPTTSFDNRDSGLLSEFFNNGCDIDVLSLTHVGVTEEVIAEKIRWADIIHVPGGNLRYVMTMWEKTHTDKYLKEAYEQNKVLFGTSSGAMCWFEEGYDDCGVDGKMMFVKGLGLHPYCYCPHYDSSFWQSFSQDIKTREIDGIGCENDAALCLIDDERFVLKSVERVDARCFYFDSKDGFKRYDLDTSPEILKNLK